MENITKYFKERNNQINFKFNMDFRDTANNASEYFINIEKIEEIEWRPKQTYIKITYTYTGTWHFENGNFKEDKGWSTTEAEDMGNCWKIYFMAADETIYINK